MSADNTNEMHKRGAYVCPACKSNVARKADAYHCINCGKEYPVLFGIPDFRLNPDPYLTIAEEREKAARLCAYGQTHTFRELVKEYYRITDDVPEALAEKFSAYVESGIARGDAICDALCLSSDGAIIDLGCASGGFLIAAARRKAHVVGVDIALRWLVICAKRLEEQNLDIELVCADVEALPFREAVFNTGVAADLFEHVRDQSAAATAISNILSADGRLFVSSANRYTLAPYPLAGLWGVGFMPRWLRAAYISAVRGLDTLRHATLLSPLGVGALLRRTGFRVESVAALSAAHHEQDAAFQGFVLSVYSRMRKWPVFQQLLVLIAPAFEMTLRKQIKR